jgi:hypothetical protein
LWTKAQLVGHQLCLHHQKKGVIFSLMMAAELVSETLGFYSQLTWFVARQDAIGFSRHDSVKTLRNIFLYHYPSNLQLTK